MTLNVELPWTEKYRPQKLDDVIGHTEIVKRLNAYVKEKNLPSMIFSGPAGIGKTVCAVAMARELFAKLPASARNVLTVTDYSAAQAKCPQRLPISKLMAQAAQKLA